MLPRLLLATAALLAAPVALAPAASADTCASAYFETLVCTPVNAFYCAFYAVEFQGGIKGITVNDAPGCLVRVVVTCVQGCAQGTIDVTLP